VKTKKQLMEERKAAYDAIHDLREKLRTEDRDAFTNEEREQYDKASADFGERNQQLKDLEAEQNMAAVMDAGREDHEGQRDEQATPSYRDALNGWGKSVSSDPVEITEEERSAMDHYGVMPGKELRVDLAKNAPRSKAAAEKRAMTTDTATEGQEYVPEGFRNQLEVALLEWGNMKQYCTVMRTDSGNDLPMPTMNDTGNKGAQINDNTDNSSDETLPTTGSTTLGAFKFTSNPVLVTQELLEDSAFDMAAILSQQLGIRLGRIQNEKITTGTGSSTVNGIVTAATVGRTATNATSITYEDLLELMYSVGSAYRGNARWVMNDALIPDLRLLQDGAGGYIFTPDMASASGEMLLGKPIVFNEECDGDLAASDKPIVFGDLSKYMIREVRQIRFYRLTEHYRLTNDADGFVAYMRFDGDLLDAGTNPVKVLQMAAS
jgi:HK97 family phage major capsid protein